MMCEKSVLTPKPSYTLRTPKTLSLSPAATVALVRLTNLPRTPHESKVHVRLGRSQLLHSSEADKLQVIVAKQQWRRSRDKV
eukprot:3432258-Prymnesium_polylepis.2